MSDSHRRYKVADANSYVIVTGAGIPDVKIVKKAVVWPFQKSATISISPFDFSTTLQAMTIEKLQFSLPAVFTIGPDNEPEALRKYAMLLTGDSDGAPAHPKKGPTATVSMSPGGSSICVKRRTCSARLKIIYVATELTSAHRAGATFKISSRVSLRAKPA